MAHKAHISLGVTFVRLQYSLRHKSGVYQAVSVAAMFLLNKLVEYVLGARTMEMFLGGTTDVTIHLSCYLWGSYGKLN